MPRETLTGGHGNGRTFANYTRGDRCPHIYTLRHGFLVSRGKVNLQYFRHAFPRILRNRSQIHVELLLHLFLVVIVSARPGAIVVQVLRVGVLARAKHAVQVARSKIRQARRQLRHGCEIEKRAKNTKEIAFIW